MGNAEVREGRKEERIVSDGGREGRRMVVIKSERCDVFSTEARVVLRCLTLHSKCLQLLYTHIS